MFKFTLSLHIVLTSAEVPHEVAPVHEVTLIGQEEAQVLPLRRHLHIDPFTTIVVRHHPAADTTHPLFIGLRFLRVPHAREQHVLCIHNSILRLCNIVFVSLLAIAGRCGLSLVYGSALLEFHAHHIGTCDRFIDWLRRVGLAIEQRTLAILVAGEIACECEDIVGRVLVHRRIGCRTNQDDCIAAIADDEHEQAEKGCVPKSFAATHCEPEARRNSQKQKYDIYVDACVVRAVQHIDEQQLTPTGNFHDARDDAIKHASQQHE